MKSNFLTAAVCTFFMTLPSLGFTEDTQTIPTLVPKSIDLTIVQSDNSEKSVHSELLIFIKEKNGIINDKNHFHGALALVEKTNDGLQGTYVFSANNSNSLIIKEAGSKWSAISGSATVVANASSPEEVGVKVDIVADLLNETTKKVVRKELTLIGNVKPVCEIEDKEYSSPTHGVFSSLDAHFNSKNKRDLFCREYTFK